MTKRVTTPQASITTSYFPPAVAVWGPVLRYVAGTVQCSARRGKGACYSTSSTISVLLPTRDTREGVPIDDQASYYATGFHNHFLLPSSRGGLGASSQVCGGDGAMLVEV